jgi:hypothetical protein
MSLGQLTANGAKVTADKVDVKNGRLIILENYLFPEDLTGDHSFLQDMTEVLSFLQNGVRVFQHLLARSNVTKLLKEGTSIKSTVKLFGNEDSRGCWCGRIFPTFPKHYGLPFEMSEKFIRIRRQMQHSSRSLCTHLEDSLRFSLANKIKSNIIQLRLSQLNVVLINFHWLSTNMNDESSLVFHHWCIIKTFKDNASLVFVDNL